MCDTLVALGNSTNDGSIIFGKNSDRNADEAHAICYFPKSIHEKDETIQCQYTSVPQVKETYSVILSKPVWLKIGCEMGANEFGVVMGNESVMTKEPYENQGLLGMELMRISLERAKNANDALKIIIDLINKYGQCGTRSRLDEPDLKCHNSFLIADLNEAWILETANKFWVAKKILEVGSISNGLTIEDKWDLASPNLLDNAIEKGWCESKSNFNFADCYADPEYQILTGCMDRQSRTINRLLERKGQIDVPLIMNILRDHGKKFKDKPFKPWKGTMSSICGHENSRTVHQTTASYVAHLMKDFQVHWLTGTSAPCLSIFKPFFFESPNALKNINIPSLKNDNTSLWWKHEILHRNTLLDYPHRAPLITKKNQQLEKQLMNEVKQLLNNKKRYEKEKFEEKLSALSTKALEQNFLLVNNLIETILKMEIKKSAPKSYIKKWAKLNSEVNIVNTFKKNPEK